MTPRPKTARRYAQALLSLALESDSEHRVAADMDLMARAPAGSPELTGFLRNTRLPRDVRRRTLEALFRNRVHPLTWKFLLLLESKRRLDLLPEIGAAFRSLDDARRGIARGELTAAARTADDAVNAMAARFSALLRKTVLLQQRENPALLGGCRVQVGDLVYDYSLAARLRLARQALTGT